MLCSPCRREVNLTSANSFAYHLCARLPTSDCSPSVSSPLPISLTLPFYLEVSKFLRVNTEFLAFLLKAGPLPAQSWAPRSVTGPKGTSRNLPGMSSPVALYLPNATQRSSADLTSRWGLFGPPLSHSSLNNVQGISMKQVTDRLCEVPSLEATLLPTV